MPPTIAARCTTRSQPVERAPRLVEVAQVAGMDLAPRRASTPAPGAGRPRGSPRLSRSSRRTTAVPIVPAPPVTRTRSGLNGCPVVCRRGAERRPPARPARTPAPRRTSSTGRPPERPARARRSPRSVAGSENSAWFVATTTAPAPLDGVLERRCRAGAHAGRGSQPRRARAPAAGSASPTASRAGRRSCA